MIRQTLRCDNRQDWLEYRKPDITSTDTAALFSLSPYKTKFELYHKHATGIILDFKENDRMRKGTALEAGIAELAAEQEGWTDLAPFKDYMRLPELRIGSSFDFIATHKGKRILVEIKLVDPFRYRDMWVDNQAPDHIEIQAAHEMMVADIDQIAIVAWTGGYDCNVIYRDRDPEMEQSMIATSKEKYISHLALCPLTLAFRLIHDKRTPANPQDLPNPGLSCATVAIDRNVT